MQTGQMIFTSTEQVVFGKPAAESVLEIAEAQDAKNVFILASHFLRNNTEEIANIEKSARVTACRYLVRHPSSCPAQIGY